MFLKIFESSSTTYVKPLMLFVKYKVKDVMNHRNTKGMQLIYVFSNLPRVTLRYYEGPNTKHR